MITITTNRVEDSGLIPESFGDRITTNFDERPTNDDWISSRVTTAVDGGYSSELIDGIDSLQTDITVLENDMQALAKEQAKEIRSLRDELEALKNNVKLLMEV